MYMCRAPQTEKAGASAYDVCTYIQYRGVKQCIGEAHMKLVIFGEIKVVIWGIWSICKLLSFTPLPPSKNFLTDLNICRLRSG